MGLSRFAFPTLVVALVLGISAGQDPKKPDDAKKDKLDTVTKEQKAPIIKAVRESVQSKFKAKWSDEERDAEVAKARENPADHLKGIGDPEQKKYGHFLNGTKYKVLKVMSEDQVIVQHNHTIGSSGGLPTTKPIYFLIDVPTGNLKVGEASDLGAVERADAAKRKGATPVIDIFYATGTKTIDNKKVWRIVKVEFTDDEKKQFDPRPKKK